MIKESSTLSRFCEKQNLSVFGFLAHSENEVVFFSPALRMEFRDIFLDLELDVEIGIAIRYMQGFDMDLDNAQIDKALSYKDYLKSKKLI